MATPHFYREPGTPSSAEPLQQGDTFPPRPPLNPKEQLIVAVIKAFTNTNSMSVADTVLYLADPVNVACTTGDPEPELWALYSALLRYARSVPFDDDAAHGRLVLLLQALKAQPEPPPGPGRDVLLSTWGGTSVWASLALFGAVAREEWDEAPGARGGTGSADEVREWRNLNAFVARVTAAGVYDFSVYGFWALRDTLSPLDPAEAQGPRTDTWVGDRLDEFLPAAVMWPVCAGRVLYGEAVKAGWNGQEFSLTRWQSWWERLHEIVLSNVGEETRYMAQMAIRAMDEATKAGTS
ncbi:hypothetical protein EJ06DRAFT_559694 [Trichodelitschia bisporula]|uniref:Uncharacterized protein n=1 Tax=Trichodelitschia bisporula TaxID=703511 RepID=A0A6G1HKG2_9PEZI|nr:hypothetical protein EJ06DRAFT_559694 [Trichodelitschia bisporula]